MENAAKQESLEKPMSSTARIPQNKIDTHHHFVPEFFANVVRDAGGDPSGWIIPLWSSKASELMMKRVGTQTAILSCTAPGACILSGEASFALARKLNEHAAAERDANPKRFGFFANLPSLLDTTAALAEIAYAFDTLHADGVILFTRYGKNNTYLGAPALEPIWAELNRRKAVVFIHPTHPVDTNMVNARMPQPLIDYPHETTRTAVDMIFSGTMQRNPDCKVILSHAGGTLPYIITRMSTPLRNTGTSFGGLEIGTTYEKMMQDFRSFYYDLALSSTPQVLDVLLKMVPHDHILYGSDFPYAPAAAYPAFLNELETYKMSAELRDKINFGNALTLFPRLAAQAQTETHK